MRHLAHYPHSPLVRRRVSILRFQLATSIGKLPSNASGSGGPAGLHRTSGAGHGGACGGPGPEAEAAAIFAIFAASPSPGAPARARPGGPAMPEPRGRPPARPSSEVIPKFCQCRRRPPALAQAAAATASGTVTVTATGSLTRRPRPGPSCHWQPECQWRLLPLALSVCWPGRPGPGHGCSAHWSTDPGVLKGPGG